MCFRSIYPAEPAEELPERSKYHVRLHVHAESQAKTFAVLREIANAMLDRVPGRLDVDPLTVNIYLARVGAVCSENRSCHLGSTGAHQSRKTEDFTALQVEAHVPDSGTPVQMLHLKQYLLVGDLRKLRGRLKDRP